MRKLFGLIFPLLLFCFFSFAQKKNKELEIYCITEYIDGYVIKAVDLSKHDTISVISLKETIESKRGFTKMLVGKKYNFEFEDLVSDMSAAPLNSIVIRIKTTVVWRHGDGVNNIPVYARNTKGLWIRK
jgi:hypothetical protein